MRSIMILCLCCVFVLPCGEALVSVGGEEEEQIVKPGEAEYVPDELLVKFREGVGAEAIAGTNESLGTQVINVLGEGLLYQLRIPPSAELEEVMKLYQALPEVEYVEFNYVVGIE